MWVSLRRPLWVRKTYYPVEPDPWGSQSKEIDGAKAYRQALLAGVVAALSPYPVRHLNSGAGGIALMVRKMMALRAYPL